MASTYNSIHIDEDDELELQTNPTIPDGHYMRIRAGGSEITVFLPTNQAHELAVLLNKAAVYFGSVGCSDCVCAGPPMQPCGEDCDYSYADGSPAPPVALPF